MTWFAIRRVLAVSILVGFVPSGTGALRAQSTPAPAESTYVKLLKKAPSARHGAIVEVIGNRGDADDLAYLLDRVVATGPAGFDPATRPKALMALAAAASTRNLRPTGDLGRLNPLIMGGPDVDQATRLASIRLAAAWRQPSSIAALIDLAGANPGPDPSLRDAAVDALANFDAGVARSVLIVFTARRSDPDLQRVAIVAMARIDLGFAAVRAVDAMTTARSGRDLAPILAAFLDRQGGADKLVEAINQSPPSADGAKLALRAINTLGRSDEDLVATLRKVAGIEADPPPPGPAEMATLIAAVASQGDPARGERIFRRAEINCMSCHAVAGAAGGVGPDLAALGLSSPVDYIVNSILIPDQAIKEGYQTLILSTDAGLTVQGIVVEEDDRQVVLKDAQGERRVVARSAIEESKKGGSLMPRGLVGSLTRAEFVDLVRFLAELGRPGPYAIRPTPTIQRWRVLRPVPTALVDQSAPDPAVFRSEVLDADAARWAPAYAWTSGDLPIDEIRGPADPPVGVVQGEVTVSTPGAVQFRFGPRAVPNLTVWVDAEPVRIEPDGTATISLAAGTRKLTVRVDGRKGPDAGGLLRVELARIAGSPAELVVVGGK